MAGRRWLRRQGTNLIYPYLPLFILIYSLSTPMYPYLPLSVPIYSDHLLIYPDLPLSTPICPHLPLSAPIYSCRPLSTHIHPDLPLSTLIYRICPYLTTQTVRSGGDGVYEGADWGLSRGGIPTFSLTQGRTPQPTFICIRTIATNQRRAILHVNR